MKGLVYRARYEVEYTDLDDPAPEDTRSAIVRVTGCAICGSDLHIYHGQGFSEGAGYCVGHEAVGEVVEVGSGVSRFKAGDRVAISAAVGCGACPACASGFVNACETRSGRCYGLGPDLQGLQAEHAMVPVADFGMLRIPDGLSEDQALMLTDNLPTAWFGLKRAEIEPGDVVAVVGCGPIGLMAVQGAIVLGASRVFAVDLVPERRAMAERLGATAVSPEEAIPVIRDALGGKLAHRVVECVGAEPAIQLALRLARPTGTVSCIGVNLEMDFHFPMGIVFDRNLTFRSGTAAPQQHWAELVPLILAGRLTPEATISHHMALSEGAEAYRRFDAREDGVMKVVMTP